MSHLEQGRGRCEATDEDAKLIAQVQSGDPDAERLLFDRYYARLVAFTKAKLGIVLRGSETPSDIAHSAMKSVFLGVPRGEFKLDERQSLWPLLVTITLHKIANRARKRRPGKLPEFESLTVRCSAESEIELQDLVGRLLAAFDFSPKRRQILELLLQDYRPGEIAAMANVATRTVQRTRNDAAEALSRLLDEQ